MALKLALKGPGLHQKETRRKGTVGGASMKKRRTGVIAIMESPC